MRWLNANHMASSPDSEGDAQDDEEYEHAYHHEDETDRNPVGDRIRERREQRHQVREGRDR